MAEAQEIGALVELCEAAVPLCDQLDVCKTEAPGCPLRTSLSSSVRVSFAPFTYLAPKPIMLQRTAAVSCHPRSKSDLSRCDKPASPRLNASLIHLMYVRCSQSPPPPLPLFPRSHPKW